MTAPSSSAPGRALLRLLCKASGAQMGLFGRATGSAPDMLRATPDARKEALDQARAALRNPLTSKADLEAALRELPPDGKKAAELRPQLKQRLEALHGAVRHTTAGPAAVPEPPHGYIPIPGSRRGGYHQLQADRSYRYWYPDLGHVADLHADDAHLAHLVAPPTEPQPEPSAEPPPAHTPAPSSSPPPVSLRQTAPGPAPAPAPPTGPPRQRAADGSSRREHHDVGEKLGGARKDRWAAVNGRNLAALEAEGASEAWRYTTKQAVWTPPTAEQLRDGGDTAGAVALKLAIYRLIPARPMVPDPKAAKTTTERTLGMALRSVYWATGKEGSADSPEARELFVSALERLHDDLEACHTAREIETLLEQYRDVVVHGGSYTTEEPITASVLADLEARYGGSRTRSEGDVAFVHPPGQPAVQLNGAALRRDGLRIVYGEPERIRSLVADPKERYRPLLQAAILGKRWIDGVFAMRGAFRGELGEARVRADDDWSGLITPSPADPGDGAPNAEADAEEGARNSPFVLTRRLTEPLRVGGQPVPQGASGEELRQRYNLRAVEYGSWTTRSPTRAASPQMLSCWAPTGHAHTRCSRGPSRAGRRIGFTIKAAAQTTSSSTPARSGRSSATSRACRSRMSSPTRKGLSAHASMPPSTTSSRRWPGRASWKRRFWLDVIATGVSE